MSPREESIRRHCDEHHIQVHTLPSGILHFVGPGVDLKAADFSSVSLYALKPYQPQKYVDLYAA